MLYIHPVLQFLCTLLGTYVLYLGLRRFLFAHMGKKKIRFNWKRHVLLGKIVHGVWLLGFFLGLAIAWFYWGFLNLTGPHFVAGVAMVPVILGSLLTGLMLQKPKGLRPRLALTHGALNVVLFALVLFQLVTGMGVLTVIVVS